MSRYYNQLRGDYKVEPPEATVTSAPVPNVSASISDIRQSVGEWNRPNECAGTRVLAGPAAPLILGNDGQFLKAADSYRALRTRLVRLMTSKDFRSVLISSPAPADGKTLTTMNLGLTFAKLEKQRVLLVDADLHTKGLSKLFEAYSGPSLNDLLQGHAAFESAVRSSDVPNLYVVTVGPESARTGEAFANNRWKEFMRWATESFDVVLVDAPPILALADFELISPGCDGTLLVVRALQTSREMLAKAVKLVDAKKFLGLVFNRSNPRTDDRYYGYGDYGNVAR